MIFTIIQHKETGEKWLAKPYWLDPSDKWTLFAEYKENEEPDFTEWGSSNEYRCNVKIVGQYETSKVSVNEKNYLTFN